MKKGNKDGSISRRGFIKGAAAGLGALSLMNLGVKDCTRHNLRRNGIVRLTFSYWERELPGAWQRLRQKTPENPIF